MIKRLFDFCIALAALLLLVPLLAVIALLVASRLGRPIFFVQRRPGLDGMPFRLIKFRTMRDKQAPEEPDEARLTAFGAWLRSTSLDELPELWNVVRGEMSLVGPRPLLMQYMDRYTQRQARRHEVKPGITGWAQVNGRNAISWDQKFELDIWYVDHQSMWLDLRILMMTVLKVMRREGVSAADHVTMPEFDGTSCRSEASAGRGSKPTQTGCAQAK